jgi:spermidine synthase
MAAREKKESLKLEKVLFDGDSEFEHYQVVDMVYIGRKARVLFSGQQSAAQSGVADDDNQDLLFDYNQRFLELVSTLRPKRLLLIGGGAYTLPMALINSLPDIHVDVVERDPELLEIAEEYFGLKPNKRLSIFHGDGLKFLKTNKRLYDTILVDAFVHNKIPKELSDKKAVQQFYKNVKTNGVVAANIISAYTGMLSSQVLKTHYELYNKIFESAQIFPADRVISEWVSQNFLIIAQKGKASKDYGLRFPAMKPL